MPKRWPAVGRFLHDRCGHDFPVLAQLRSNRARRAIASMLCANLDPKSTIVGIEVKVHIGAVFAAIVGNDHLADDVRALARRHRIDTQQIDDTMRFVRGDDTALPADSLTAATLLLARAAASTPAAIDATAIAACQDAHLSPPAIVEIVTWLAVLQLMHRLTCYLRPSE